MQKLNRIYQRIAQKISTDAFFQYIEHPLSGNTDELPIKQLQNQHLEWQAEGAIKMIDSASSRNEPFFYYFTPTALHGPNHYETLAADVRITPTGWKESYSKYNPTRDSLHKALKEFDSGEKFRRAGLYYLDWYIGRIVEQLKKNGLYDNTMIIFAADHGVEPGKSTTYERGLRIPMVIKWPGKAIEKSVSEQLVQTIDINATIRSILNLPNYGDGISLTALKKDPTQKLRSYIYAEAGFTRAIIGERYKYIAMRFPEEEIKRFSDSWEVYAPNHVGRHKQSHAQIAMQHYPSYFSQNQFYDLSQDPYEQVNIFSDSTRLPILKNLRTELKIMLASLGLPFDLESTIPEDSIYQLKSKNTKNIGTDHIPWLKRDHGVIIWPPVNSEKK